MYMKVMSVLMAVAFFGGCGKQAPLKQPTGKTKNYAYQYPGR